jgi:hypothetical protein
MPVLDALALALGSSFASGLNLYATVAALGLLHRYNVFELPDPLAVLAHPLVLGVAIALYVIEFFADKIPYLDTVWDAIHTFIRPPAAALLAYGALADVSDAWRVAAALIGGGIALTSHGTKASTRAAANTSPEPLSNWLLSLTEDALAVFVAWVAVTHPLLAVTVVVLLLAASVYVLVKLYGLGRRLLARLLGEKSAPAVPR